MLVEVKNHNECGILTKEYYMRTMRFECLQKLRYLARPNCYTEGIGAIKLLRNKLLCATKHTEELLMFDIFQGRKVEVKARCKLPPVRKTGITLDFQEHIFTATSGGANALHVGNPETFTFIDEIAHPYPLGGHQISKLNPFEVASGGLDEKIYISDLRLGSNVLTISRKSCEGYHTDFPTNPKHCVAWSPVSERLICSLWNNIFCPIILFDTRMSKKMPVSWFSSTHYLKSFTQPIPYLDFLDNFIISLALDNHVRIWDPSTGKLIQTIHRQLDFRRLYSHTILKNFEQIQPAVITQLTDPAIMIPEKKVIKIISIPNNEVIRVLECYFGDDYLLQFDENYFNLVSVSRSKYLTLWGTEQINPT